MRLFTNLFLILFFLESFICTRAADCSAPNQEERVISMSSYLLFLQETAAIDENHFYDAKMESNLASDFIERSGTPGSYHYKIEGWRLNAEDAEQNGVAPMLFLSYNDAAQYCTWKNKNDAHSLSLQPLASSLSIDPELRINHFYFYLEDGSHPLLQMIPPPAASIGEVEAFTEIVATGIGIISSFGKPFRRSDYVEIENEALLQESRELDGRNSASQARLENIPTTFNSNLSNTMEHLNNAWHSATDSSAYNYKLIPDHGEAASSEELLTTNNHTKRAAIPNNNNRLITGITEVLKESVFKKSSRITKTLTNFNQNLSNTMDSLNRAAQSINPYTEYQTIPEADGAASNHTSSSAENSVEENSSEKNIGECTVFKQLRENKNVSTIHSDPLFKQVAAPLLEAQQIRKEAEKKALESRASVEKAMASFHMLKDEHSQARQTLLDSRMANKEKRLLIQKKESQIANLESLPQERAVIQELELQQGILKKLQLDSLVLENLINESKNNEFSSIENLLTKREKDLKSAKENHFNDCRAARAAIAQETKIAVVAHRLKTYKAPNSGNEKSELSESTRKALQQKAQESLEHCNQEMHAYETPFKTPDRFNNAKSFQNEKILLLDPSQEKKLSEEAIINRDFSKPGFSTLADLITLSIPRADNHHDYNNKNEGVFLL